MNESHRAVEKVRSKYCPEGKKKKKKKMPISSFKQQWATYCPEVKLKNINNSLKKIIKIKGKTEMVFKVLLISPFS